ncbi:MAG: hypothetical protein OEZ57_03620 [Nitrospirota bacterium]|nr:hypothetical protein [Nitrospirota bacterium]MDH5585240.1 hypothetical protein [Nitrospirota bacterium]MDH5773989.1 hypothetical protein [Nitrospirota bacterium]
MASSTGLVGAHCGFDHSSHVTAMQGVAGDTGQLALAKASGLENPLVLVG